MAGFQLIVASIEFEELTDRGFQGILGLTSEFSNRLLLGIIYRSDADADLDGGVKVQNLRLQLPVTPPSGVKISWTNPQRLEDALRFKITDDTELFLNPGWQE